MNAEMRAKHKKAHISRPHGLNTRPATAAGKYNIYLKIRLFKNIFILLIYNKIRSLNEILRNERKQPREISRLLFMSGLNGEKHTY